MCEVPAQSAGLGAVHLDLPRGAAARATRWLHLSLPRGVVRPGVPATLGLASTGAGQERPEGIARGACGLCPTKGKHADATRSTGRL